MERERRPANGDDDDAKATLESRFSVISRSTLPEEIANRLLTQIKEQELRPGDKLPAERNLARMMNVSRPVVREALRALAIMRVVDIRQGDGTYITSLEPKQLISHLDLVFAKDGVALVQLVEARRIVEAGNVRLAALRVTEAGIARPRDARGFARGQHRRPRAIQRAGHRAAHRECARLPGTSCSCSS